MSLQSKALIISLVKRNAAVCVVFVILSVGLSLVPNEYKPNWLFGAFAFCCGILWANSTLIRQGHPITAILVTVILVPILSFPVAILSIPARRSLVISNYAARFQMVEGCDAGAAGQADSEVYQFKELLETAADNSKADTNLINDLKRGQALAQEKAKILGEYCGKAGHVDIHPWKTNWSEIKVILKASEEKLYH